MRLEWSTSFAGWQEPCPSLARRVTASALRSASLTVRATEVPRGKRFHVPATLSLAWCWAVHHPCACRLSPCHGVYDPCNEDALPRIQFNSQRGRKDVRHDKPIRTGSLHQMPATRGRATMEGQPRPDVSITAIPAERTLASGTPTTGGPFPDVPSRTRAA